MKALLVLLAVCSEVYSDKSTRIYENSYKNKVCNADHMQKVLYSLFIPIILLEFF